MAIQFVVFDLGGVLVRIRTRWRQCLDAAGLHSGHGDDWDASLSDFHPFSEFQLGRISSDACFRELSQFLALRSPSDAAAANMAILAGLYEGASNLLRRSHAAGLRTAILSNTNAPHWEEMTTSQRFQAIQSVPHRFASHELQLEKPDLAIYRYVESALGADPKEILFFDDTSANISGASLAGWQAVLVPGTEDPPSFIESQLMNLVDRF
jgi:putative hydrolase of the HAD superfamily